MKKENGIEPETPEIRSREDAIRELELYYNIRASCLQKRQMTLLRTGRNFIT